jgi:hypothetical protein
VKEAHVTFNIGNQTGGIINNVGGDQTIAGDQYAVTVTSPEARQAAHDLLEALKRTSLHDDATLRRQAQDIDTEMHSAEPEKSRVAVHLDKLTRMIAAAGAWAKAGAAIVGPMRILAQWLGGLGVPILGLLPVLA